MLEAERFECYNPNCRFLMKLKFVDKRDEVIFCSVSCLREYVEFYGDNDGLIMRENTKVE